MLEYAAFLLEVLGQMRDRGMAQVFPCWNLKSNQLLGLTWYLRNVFDSEQRSHSGHYEENSIDRKKCEAKRLF